MEESVLPLLNGHLTDSIPHWNFNGFMGKEQQKGTFKIVKSTFSFLFDLLLTTILHILENYSMHYNNYNESTTHTHIHIMRQWAREADNKYMDKLV